MNKPQKVTMAKRIKAVRLAFRGLWWMAIRRRGTRQTLSRRASAGVYLHGLRCGLLTGGEHSWGPLQYEYEGARWRRSRCRWCGASMLPAEEMEANPPTPEEEAKWREMFVKPTEEDANRAVEAAERAGFYRNGKFLWE